MKVGDSVTWLNGKGEKQSSVISAVDEKTGAFTFLSQAVTTFADGRQVFHMDESVSQPDEVGLGKALTIEAKADEAPADSAVVTP